MESWYRKSESNMTSHPGIQLPEMMAAAWQTVRDFQAGHCVRMQETRLFLVGRVAINLQTQVCIEMSDFKGSAVIRMDRCREWKRSKNLQIVNLFWTVSLHPTSLSRLLCDTVTWNETHGLSVHTPRLEHDTCYISINIKMTAGHHAIFELFLQIAWKCKLLTWEPLWGTSECLRTTLCSDYRASHRSMAVPRVWPLHGGSKKSLKKSRDQATPIEWKKRN